MSSEPQQRWVLLRGLAREAAHWGRFAKELQAALGPRHRVLTVDLPGNGRHWRDRSPASVPAFVHACRAQAMEAGGSGPLRLVALSMAAMVALEWARSAPQEISGCALINTSVGGLNPPWQRMIPSAAFALAWSLRPNATPTQREAAVLRWTTADPARHRGVAHSWAQIAQARPVRADNVIRQLLAAARYSVPSVPPTVPLLVLHSMGDRLVSPACSLELARRWQLPLRTHPWAGHDLPLDDPQWLVGQLAEWYEQTTRAGMEGPSSR